MEYLSYFILFLDSTSKQLVEWTNLALFIAGWKGYKSNKLADVYGFYLLLCMLILEIQIGKRLKAALKMEMVAFQKGPNM